MFKTIVLEEISYYQMITIIYTKQTEYCTNYIHDTTLKMPLSP